MANEYLDSHLFEDSMMVLSKIYHRIYKAHLGLDTYQTVKFFESEQEYKSRHSGKLSELFSNLIESGAIHNDDVDAFTSFVNIGKLKKRFRESGESAHLRYRREQNGEFRWVLMEVIPSAEYQEDNQVVMIYLQDVHDSYMEELEKHRELEHYCKFDVLTGLSNFYAYNTICKDYAKNSTQNIGVVFADLNGLKIVNDTQGHERGNDYIRSFSNLLQGFFSGMACFRISGDEFLVIIDELNEEEFNAKTEKFHDMVQDMAIPIASIGWAWETSPNLIENVTKVAEARMYEDKHIFYEKHPEYKRGVAERNFQQEINSLIKTLSESYIVLYVVDLEKDTYRQFKHELSFLGEKGVTEGKYSEYNANYVKNHVAESYRVLRERMGDIDYLKVALKAEDSISCDYMMADGQWRETVFRKMDSNNGSPSKIMVFSVMIDHARASRLSRDRKIKEEHHIVTSLCAEYSIICQIDVDDMSMSIYRVDNKLRDIVKYIDKKQYEDVQTWFVEKYIPDDRQEAFIKETSIANILEHMIEKPSLELYCKMRFSVHQKSDTFFAKFSYFAPAKGSRKIVFAARDITDVMLGNFTDHLT